MREETPLAKNGNFLSQQLGPTKDRYRNRYCRIYVASLPNKAACLISLELLTTLMITWFTLYITNRGKLRYLVIIFDITTFPTPYRDHEDYIVTESVRSRRMSSLLIQHILKFSLTYDSPSMKIWIRILFLFSIEREK